MITTKSELKAVEPDDPMTNHERDLVEKAQSRRKTSSTPRLIVKENRLSIDHPDEDVGELLIMEAIGTEDPDFFRALVKQLAHAALSEGQFDENELNSMLSVVKSIKPRDNLEAMLAAQMGAVHLG